jgi:hypothetical protein
MSILDVIAKIMPSKQKKVLHEFHLRPGMWAIHGGRICIISRIATQNEMNSDDPDPHGVIMLVKENGENDHEEIVALSGLTQPDWKQIPASRRPTKELGKKLGYL